MKEIEQMIIGSCVGEDQYKKVSFLEANDFEESLYRAYFLKIIESGGNEDILLNCLKNSTNKEVVFLIATQSFPVACIRLTQFALLLVERRFRRLLGILLMELAERSENTTEVSILVEATAEIDNQDIFTLSDNLLAYLGEQASEVTKKRINDYLKYQAIRVKAVKKVLK